MVYSNLNSAVFYKETPSVDPEDVGYSSTLFEMDVLGKTVLIVLGKAKHSFIERNVVFYPIYLVANGKVKSQIGIVEMPKNKAIEILDEDGDVDVSKLSPPLLYGFVNELFIDRSGSDAELFMAEREKLAAVSAVSSAATAGLDGTEDKEPRQLEGAEEAEGSEGSEGSDDEVMKVKVHPGKASKEAEKATETLKKGVFEVDPNVKKLPALHEETEEEAKTTKKEYKEASKNTWIEKFMKNNHYDIAEVENNGDCFFAVIRDAFKQIGQITTVAKLRAILAKEATDDIFQEHRKLYLDLTATVREYDHDLKTKKDILENVLKKRAEKACDDKSTLTKILAEMDKVKGEYKEIQVQKREVEALIAETVGSFSKIDSLENFREYVQTPQFWADSWAISLLERTLNIKMIILSQRAYLDGDLDGVMTCGEIDPQIQREGRFEPRFYIMTTFSGDHFRLITYKNKRIFEYSEIPFHVKMLILNKCMERASGPFYIIQDFRNLKARMGIDEDEGKPKEEDEEIGENGGNSTSPETSEYNPKIVFEFYASSAKTAKPGKGTNEKIPLDKRSDFVALGKIDNWRRKLDDDWTEAPFKLDGHRWASVEHYYQGSKFKKHYPDFTLQFSLDSDSEISKDADLARAAGSKTGKPEGKGKGKVKAGTNLRPSNVQIDPDFYGARSENERLDAVRAKFSQNADLKQMLLLTKKAKLLHFIRGAPAEADHILMTVRRDLVSAK